MDPDTVRQVLTDQGLELTEQNAYLNYSDGANHTLPTENFLSSITGQSHTPETQVRELITVAFSQPPSEPRALYVYRSSNSTLAPPTGDQLAAALIGKYGEPDMNLGSRRVWLRSPGDMNCFAAHTGVYIMYNPISRRNNDIAEYLFPSAARQDRFRNPDITSVDQCATFITYDFSGGGNVPVQTYNAKMVDVQTTYKSNLETRGWLNGLSEEATQKRVGSTTAPRL